MRKQVFGKQAGLEDEHRETRCASLERNCVLLYLIIVLWEGNQAQFELHGFLISNAFFQLSLIVAYLFNEMSLNIA